MANYTEKAILQTFEDMLAEMPFGKITVSALAGRCEISSNTFYYHFRDIYDLLDRWLEAKRDAILRRTEDTAGWAERMKSVLHEMQDNPALVYHLFDSLSREKLERFVFVSLEEIFCEYVGELMTPRGVSGEDVRRIADFCCYSFVGFLLKFLWLRMDTDVDAAVDWLRLVFDGAADNMVQKIAPPGGERPGP